MKALKPSSKRKPKTWYYSPLFRDALAAKSRGMTTRQFRELPDADQVEIIAVEQVLSRMTTWENYQDEIEMDKSQRKRR